MGSTHLTDDERLELGLDLVKNWDHPDDSQLRILIFTATYFVLDGVTLTIRRLEAHLRSKGAIVKILSTVPDNMTPEQTKDVIIVPGIKIPFAAAGEYAFGIGLDEGTIQAIEAFNPNCVHFTVPDFVALDGIRWCQKHNVAHIATWHSNFIDYLKYYMIEWILGPGFHTYLVGFYEQIPTVFIPTNYLIQKMKNEWGYGKCTELKEWGRGVDMNIFSPDRRSLPFRASKGISETDVVVIWVSRLVPEKRPDIWLSVVQRLQDEGLPVKALVVGNGAFEKYLSKLKHVACCGWLSGAALGQAYASSDILLFPSDVETFGNVTLEALSSGCPSVVEKKCGDHLVEHGKNGYCCNSGDTEGFYQSTRRLVLDAQLRNQMSAYARESAKKFDRKIVLQQMAENYKDAIVKHRDPAYLKRHLEIPEAKGRNFLSVLCCNYVFIKAIAEPFLNASKGVQDLAQGGADCIQMSRSRLSCSEYMNTATDIEEGDNPGVAAFIKATNAEKKANIIDTDNDDGKKKTRKFFTAFAVSSTTSACIAKLIRYFTFVVAIGLILLFVYVSLTV